MAGDVALEEALYLAARAVVGDAALATSPLTAAVVDRSKRATSDRDRLSRPADPIGDLAARAVFFTVADAPKIAVPLDELATRGALPSRRPLRVIDLGAGCGAMTLGLIAAIADDVRGGAGPGVEIVAIDRDARALEIATIAVHDYAQRRGVSIAFTARSADATSANLGACDLVVMGTLLNEVDAAARIAIVERALAAIADDGAVIILEPALRETSRALHEVRDALLTRQAAHVFAPCTRTGAPCPALADPDDWCHEDRAIELPPRTAELSRLTGLRDRGMKFSYLVLRKTALGLVEEPGAWRIVSSPHVQKGKLELVGCGAPGWVPLRLLKRNRDRANREIERADRGDVVLSSTPPDAERVEIGKDTTIRVVRPRRSRE